MENLVSAFIDPQKAQERSAPTQNADAPTAQRETTTVEAAAARLGISRSLGYQLVRSNRFPVPVIRAGRRLLVSTAALNRLLWADGLSETVESAQPGGAQVIAA